MKAPSLAAFLLTAVPALAVGPGEDAPPTPTETTTVCEEGRIWDAEAGACVLPQEAALDSPALFGAARELAYAGRYADALAALGAIGDQTASGVLTYRGFVARQTGNWPEAAEYYAAALAADPGNFGARSYLGQGLLAMGDRAGARAQLSEIRARGGRNTWAETALRLALAAGEGPAY
ncbi:MAG: tetratricopeptide repeat protein [Paracoccaceae bacterium]|nr:tetratricopeptide repeat protein [Paracoccaceae bacterium]